MTDYTKQDQTIALAGVMQTARLVQQLARDGKISGAAMETSLETLFKIDSNNVIDVFGSVSGVTTGLRTLRKQMSGDSKQQDLEITRYVISLLHLEKKLSRDKKMLKRIADELDRIKGQMNYFSLMHENVLASLGALYQETISTLMPRIIVQGEPSFLSQQANANKIRALLLAGIRSAVLWRQTGGNRWQFLFGRGAYLKSTNELLDKIPGNHQSQSDLDGDK
jgi:high frequency lysogenization protein